jgi:cysteine desulfurase
MGAAFELATAERPALVPRVTALRDRLVDAIVAIDGVELTGHPVERLPSSASFVLREVAGDDVVIALDLAGVACSTGSACTTGSTEPSHVLTAMGFPPSEARGSLRLSLGRTTTELDIDTVIAALPPIVERLREGRRRLAVQHSVAEAQA